MKIFLLIFIFTTFCCSAQWQRIYKGLDSNNQQSPLIDLIIDLAIDQQNSNNLIMGYNNGTLFKTTDSGLSWIQLNAHFSTNISRGCIAFQDSLIIVKTGNELQKSTDCGLTWKTLTAQLNYGREKRNAFNITKLFLKDNIIYLANRWGPYKSLDSCLTWLPIVYQFGDTSFASNQNYYEQLNEGCTSLLINGDSIYFDCNIGLGFTLDGGKTWKNYSKISSIMGLDIYKIGNNLLLHAKPTLRDEFYLSSDQGVSWKIIYPNNMINIPNNVGSIQTCQNRIYFALEYDSSIYYTDDYFNSINKIEFSSSSFGYNKKFYGYYLKILDDKIYYFFNDIDYAHNIGGLLLRAKLKDCEIDTTGTEVIELPNPVQNDQLVFPNPAGDYINISIGANGCSPESIKIFDVFGQEYLTPPLSTSGEGVRIDVSSLSPGVYFVQVGNKVQKFIKY